MRKKKSEIEIEEVKPTPRMKKYFFPAKDGRARCMIEAVSLKEAYLKYNQ